MLLSNFDEILLHCVMVGGLPVTHLSLTEGSSGVYKFGTWIWALTRVEISHGVQGPKYYSRA